MARKAPNLTAGGPRLNFGGTLAKRLVNRCADHLGALRAINFDPAFRRLKIRFSVCCLQSGNCVIERGSRLKVWADPMPAYVIKLLPQVPMLMTSDEFMDWVDTADTHRAAIGPVSRQNRADKRVTL